MGLGAPPPDKDDKAAGFWRAHSPNDDVNEDNNDNTPGSKEAGASGGAEGADEGKGAGACMREGVWKVDENAGLGVDCGR